LERNIIGPVSL